jgi:hypothetical protein
MALIAFCGESLFDDGVDGNIKTLRSLLDGVQVPSYCYEIPFLKSLDLKNLHSIIKISATLKTESCNMVRFTERA